MGCPVVITPKACRDLEGIVRFIAHDSQQRARNFGHALIDAALSLEPFPEMGRVVPEIDDSNVREIVHGSYRIIYEIRQSPAGIYVLRFWHAARGTPEK
jgi:plasmid stabilization system protein ParE